MLLEVEESQLVLLDYQERLLPALPDGMAVMQQAMRLGQAARLMRVPIWGTEHNARGLGPMVGPLRALCPMVLPKTSCSAVAAGLGGGSSDAAAALRLLARANGLPAQDARLMEAARRTGSAEPWGRPRRRRAA